MCFIHEVLHGDGIFIVNRFNDYLMICIAGF